MWHILRLIMHARPFARGLTRLKIPADPTLEHATTALAGLIPACANFGIALCSTMCTILAAFLACRYSAPIAEDNGRPIMLRNTGCILRKDERQRNAATFSSTALLKCMAVMAAAPSCRVPWIASP